MLRLNILQYLTEMLRQYFNCNGILEVFLTSFCNILCYVGGKTYVYITPGPIDCLQATVTPIECNTYLYS